MSDTPEKDGAPFIEMAAWGPDEGEPIVVHVREKWPSADFAVNPFQAEDDRLREQLESIEALKDRIARSRQQLQLELQSWLDLGPETAVTRREFAQFALRLANL